MEGECEDPLGLREGLWEWEPRPSHKSSHKGLFEG